MNKCNFLYFPSFSVGTFATSLQKDHKFHNGLDMRFYSNEFPAPYRHPLFLLSAGHYYKTPNTFEKFGFHEIDGALIMGDSGGYQVCSGAIKWEESLVPRILEWLENNSHISLNLDIPPRMKYAGKFNECLDLSISNFKYFAKHRTGKTQMLNVLQGEDKNAFNIWYNGVKGMDFDGWAIGGARTSLYKFLCGIATVFQGKEHYNLNNKYLHILGASKITDFLILAQLQKSLSEMGSAMKITTDSSSPSLSVVYGLMYYNVNYVTGTFKSLHIPKIKSENNKQRAIHTKNDMEGYDQLIPNIIPFDDHLIGAYTNEDLSDWNDQGYGALVLHNFMYFKKVMEDSSGYINCHPYILEQIVNTDVFLLLRSVDEMVKAYENGTTPDAVFNKYDLLYKKVATSVDVSTNNTHNFF